MGSKKVIGIAASTPPRSARRLPRPCRIPVRLPASARQPHRQPSPAPPHPASSAPQSSLPNPPHSKAPAQPRHSASPSCRHRFPGRARSPVSPEPKARREAGAMRGARRILRLLQNHRRRRSLDRNLEPCRHVNAADNDLQVLRSRSSRDLRHPRLAVRRSLKLNRRAASTFSAMLVLTSASGVTASGSDGTTTLAPAEAERARNAKITATANFICGYFTIFILVIRLRQHDVTAFPHQS